jgi:hypothetical protein
MYDDNGKIKSENKDIINNDMLIFKAHEAVDVLKKVL